MKYIICALESSHALTAFIWLVCVLCLKCIECCAVCVVYGDHNRSITCLVRIIRNCTNQYLQQGYRSAIYSAVCNDLLQGNYRLGVARALSPGAGRVMWPVTYAWLKVDSPSPRRKNRGASHIYVYIISHTHFRVTFQTYVVYIHTFQSIT